MSASAGGDRRLRVLMLSRNYPNSVLPLLGLWVQWLARGVSSAGCEVSVISPVPYWPLAAAGPRDYARFSRVERERSDGDVRVFHPRFLVGPGILFHSAEAAAYRLAVGRLCERIRRERGFDLIHAHMPFPDGVAAADLGRRYGVPVVVTNHALLHPWLDDFPFVRRQVRNAERFIRFHIAVSERVREEVAKFTGDAGRVRVISVGVDGATFFPRAAGNRPAGEQVLYVGHITYNKGVDVLLEASARLAAERPAIRFVLVGEGQYRHKRLQQDELQKRARELGLEGRAEFTGALAPPEVANRMRESALLVLPSRRETFGAVLVEALACGVPVVATRCGGPEDIVTEEVGKLVPPEDSAALARGIAAVLDRRENYDPEVLRRYALERFSWDRVARETVALYREAVKEAETA